MELVMPTSEHEMTTPTRSRSDDVVDRGKAIYEREIRKKLETPEHIGKILVIDVETGKYIMGEDVNGEDDYEIAIRAVHLFPDHGRYGMRIGYNAVDAAGGAIKRVYRSESAA